MTLQRHPGTIIQINLASIEEDKIYGISQPYPSGQNHFSIFSRTVRISGGESIENILSKLNVFVDLLRSNMIYDISHEITNKKA